MEILRNALLAFDKMLEDNKNNVKPLFRKRSWNKEEREAMKVNKRVNWYKNAAKGITYRSVLFVPPTPGGVLAKELRKREEELNKCNEERTKIVEKGGIKVGNMLIKKDPFKKEKCMVSLCPLCQNSTNKIDVMCNTNNVGYRWICNTCTNRDKIKVY